MADIIELIRADHEQVRCALHALAASSGPGFGGEFAGIWQGLAALVEVHADAEEEICHLPMFGTSRLELDRIEDASADLDDIREAVWEASLHPPGSAPWSCALKAALSAWTRHCDSLERDVLAEFERRGGRPLRGKLGSQWLAFRAARFRP